MKALTGIARIVVGILFIFSGLVKANDPLGLSYKMQEFFEIWGIHQFNSWTLLFSVLMNAFEIIAGFALLLGWRIRLFSWLLLLLIVFFTFLTGYTYITGMPKNCGCFGDCLPITSKTSFLKDVVLTLLIGYLFWKRNEIRPLLPEKPNWLLMLLITTFSFVFQWYTLKYLPVVDCLPFKKGNHIGEQMKMPANAIPDSTVINFVYEVNGKEIEFTADNFPADFSSDKYKFIRRYDKLIRAGKNNEPPIKGFSLSGESNIDSTQYVLQQPYAVLIFIEKFSQADGGWKRKLETVWAAAKAKNIPVYMVTAEPSLAVKEVAGTGFSGITVFKSDYKVIETAARTNPCMYLLKQGTVEAKYSGATMQKMKPVLSALPVQVKALPLPVSVADTLTGR